MLNIDSFNINYNSNNNMYSLLNNISETKQRKIK